MAIRVFSLYDWGLGCMHLTWYPATGLAFGMTLFYCSMKTVT